MKIFKKIVGTAIALSLLVSMTALGLPEKSTFDTDTKSFNILSQMGFIDNNSEPSSDMTRLEAAKMLAAIFKVSQLSFSEQMPFSDVNGDSSVMALYKMNAISAATSFNPNENITAIQFIKMLFNLLGYENQAEYAGGYPSGYYQLAAGKGLLKGLSGGQNDSLTYLTASKIVINAFNLPVVQMISMKDGNMRYSTYENETFLSLIFSMKKGRGILTATPLTGLFSQNSYTPDGKVKIGSTEFKTGSLDIEKYIGYSLEYYYTDVDSEYTLRYAEPEAGNNTVMTFLPSDIKKIEGRIITYMANDKYVNIKISDSADFIFNGCNATYSPNDLRISSGSVKLVDNDSNGTYDVVVVESYISLVVGAVVLNDEKIFDQYKIHNPIELRNSDIVNISLDGNKLELDDILGLDVISVAQSKPISGKSRFTDIIVYNEVVEGAVDEIYSDDEGDFAIVSGTRYKKSNYYNSALQIGMTNEFKAGQEITMYIDAFGNIVGADNISDGDMSFAYLVSSSIKSPIDNDVKLKLFTSDGEFLELQLADKIELNKASVKLAALLGDGNIFQNNTAVPQLVRFSLNQDEQINKLTTAFSYSGEADLDSFKKQGILSKSIKYDVGVYNINTYSLCPNSSSAAPAFYMDTRTVVFDIPLDDKNNDDLYQIRSVSSFSNEERMYNAMAYGESKYHLAKAVIIESDNSGTFDNTDIPLFLVEKISSVVDDNGNIVQKLYGATRRDVDSVLYTKSADTLDGVKSGDVIQIKVNAAGDILSYSKGYSYADIGTVGSGTADSAVSTINTFQYGRLVDCDKIDKFIMLDDSCERAVTEGGQTTIQTFGKIRSMPVNYSGLAVYVYNSADLSIRLGSVSELTENDFILIQSRWTQVRTIIIYR